MLLSSVLLARPTMNTTDILMTLELAQVRRVRLRCSTLLMAECTNTTTSKLSPCLVHASGSSIRKCRGTSGGAPIRIWLGWFGMCGCGNRSTHHSTLKSSTDTHTSTVTLSKESITLGNRPCVKCGYGDPETR
ncbi:hypothetical protein E2C01_032590 [Portunus trituberculatus]|uniref:Uncharacterized protein n=1 Tax=Portunus trituberculatus TaxID=210409 RepID=A0A5B7EVN2_PORTR|nr:hypothetical protein [Portunus trituberculatus]